MTREEAIGFIAQSVKSDVDMAKIADAIKALEQEPREDEYIKVPKKALKYRTAGMVAYNAEWLKNHFDIERAVICGAQQPSDDAISRQAVLDYIYNDLGLGDEENGNDVERQMELERSYKYVKSLPPVTPQQKPCDDCISRQAVLEYIEGSGAELGHSSENELVYQDIKELPSVTPQPNTGHWIYICNSEVNGLKIVKCSECGKRTYGSGKYCPNCGAKMESEG